MDGRLIPDVDTLMDRIVNRKPIDRDYRPDITGEQFGTRLFRTLERTNSHKYVFSIMGAFTMLKGEYDLSSQREREKARAALSAFYEPLREIQEGTTDNEAAIKKSPLITREDWDLITARYNELLMMFQDPQDRI